MSSKGNWRKESVFLAHSSRVQPTMAGKPCSRRVTKAAIARKLREMTLALACFSFWFSLGVQLREWCHPPWESPSASVSLIQLTQAHKEVLPLGDSGSRQGVNRHSILHPQQPRHPSASMSFGCTVSQAPGLFSHRLFFTALGTLVYANYVSTVYSLKLSGLCHPG